MKKKILTAVIIKKDKFIVKNIKNNLESFHDEIGCRLIDIVTRKIGNRYYDIICDDEGLLKPNYISMIDNNYNPMLAGNLIICNHDDEGNETNLSQDDIDNILENMIVYFNGAKDKRVTLIGSYD